MAINQLHLLQTKRFLPLFLAQFSSAFNDNIFKNALLVWVTYQFTATNTSPGLLAAVASGLFILPFFLLSALAGQIADKYEKIKANTLQ